MGESLGQRLLSSPLADRGYRRPGGTTSVGAAARRWRGTSRGQSGAAARPQTVPSGAAGVPHGYRRHVHHAEKRGTESALVLAGSHDSDDDPRVGAAGPGGAASGMWAQVRGRQRRDFLSSER